MNKYTPETLTVLVAFTIRKRGGRKEFVLPERAVTRDAKPNSTVVKALARAFRWQRMLDSGAFATLGDLSNHEKIAPSYMTRVMRLTLLSPEIVEGIVEGRMAPGLAGLLEQIPVEWARQTCHGCHASKLPLVAKFANARDFPPHHFAASAAAASARLSLALQVKGRDKATSSS